jgi:E3 ubiquitin-protein ligase RAD18
VLEPLPTPNYRILKDQQLRKKLSELNISTFGSRQLLEQRYKEWVTIWNANCDSAHPKTRTELLRDLDTWERSLGGGSRTNVIYGVPQASQPQVKDKNFDGSAWAASHDSSFKDLIAKARQTKKQAEQRTQEGSEPGKEGAEPTRPSLIQEPETRVIETGSRGSRNRYHDEINGFDGAADFITPPTVEPANSRDGVWQP